MTHKLLDESEEIEDILIKNLRSLKIKYEKYSVRKGISGVEYNFDIIARLDNVEIAMDIAIGREDDVTAHLAAFVVAIRDCNLKGLFITNTKLINIEELVPDVRVVYIPPLRSGREDFLLQLKHSLELLTRKKG